MAYASPTTLVTASRRSSYRIQTRRKSKNDRGSPRRSPVFKNTRKGKGAMSRRQGSIEERSPGHWLIRYSVAEAGGRRRFSTTIAGTRKDAEKELRRRLDAVDDGTHVDPTRMTTGEWLTRWL